MTLVLRRRSSSEEAGAGLLRLARVHEIAVEEEALRASVTAEVVAILSAGLLAATVALCMFTSYYESLPMLGEI